MDPQTLDLDAPRDVETLGWKFACVRCGAPHERMQRACAECSGDSLVLPLGAEFDRRARESHAIGAIPRVPIETAPCGVAWFDGLLNGGLPARCCLILAGARSCGKSSVAMAVAAGWRRGRVLWVSNEQHSAQVATYADRFGLKRNAYVYGNESDVTSTRAVMGLADKHSAGLVVLDSLGTFGPGAAKRMERWSFRRGCAVIAISQVNSEGATRGGTEPEHDTSELAYMRREDPWRWIKLEKSRNGRDGTEVKLRARDDGTLEGAPVVEKAGG